MAWPFFNCPSGRFSIEIGAVLISIFLYIPVLGKSKITGKYGFGQVWQRIFLESIQQFLKNLVFFLLVYKGSLFFVFEKKFWPEDFSDKFKMFRFGKIGWFKFDLTPDQKFDLCRVCRNRYGFVPDFNLKAIGKWYFFYKSHNIKYIIIFILDLQLYSSYKEA